MRCPNCRGDNSKKNGFYWSRGEKTQKFSCKSCFSDFTEKVEDKTFGEHRPELNDQVRDLYLKNYPLREIASMLQCSKRTVQNKIKKYVK